MPTQSSSAMLAPPDPDEQDALRAFNRSPHPYTHRSPERFSVHQVGETAAGSDSLLSPTIFPPFSKESTPGTDSGTEADDEHFLKGLPAPKTRLHKGLRGRSEPISEAPSPIPSPAILEPGHVEAISQRLIPEATQRRTRKLGPLQRNKVLVRRSTELALLMVLGYTVYTNEHVSLLVTYWKKDLQDVAILYGGLLALYPLRVVASEYQKKQRRRQIPLRLPSDFDPAPLLYPPSITLFVSLLLARDDGATLLPNLMLAISSLPQALIPGVDAYAPYDTIHWALSCLPMAWNRSNLHSEKFEATFSYIAPEALVLLHPVHETLCTILHHLTTTSLLPAELQLMSVALINVLILSSSPQAKIMKGLLWGGGLAVLVICGPVIRWGISLARVPKWRFRKASSSAKYRFWRGMRRLLSWHRIKNDMVAPIYEDSLCESASSADDIDDEVSVFESPPRVRTLSPNMDMDVAGLGTASGAKSTVEDMDFGMARRHTLPHPGHSKKRSTHTPSGRRKRSTSISLQPYVRLTQGQATARKWAYAAYVYISILVIILVGIRTYVEQFALGGYEPIGWALGYLFGDLPWFRFQTVNLNLEKWICLPSRHLEGTKQCHMGWVQHLRHDDFGEANTRLIISACWAVILVIGLAVVFQLKDTYEVDTRRKVFHFMMVGMFLPAAFIDPAYAGLALSLILAIFLILDLLRASQLPPLSKPIASFLAPYVDGRDFRGPVVISHIFLLIGCAIPLWLALGALPRIGSGCLAGWELQTRDASMVSGVICVGLGDAAASLIGRRFGRRKWVWGGGKSLEGSVAFALAVFMGLAAAAAWLQLGGWPTTDIPTSMLKTARNAGICASMASLTEAVLTGGNDNVIVPVVLWTCVKSLGI